MEDGYDENNIICSYYNDTLEDVVPKLLIQEEDVLINIKEKRKKAIMTYHNCSEC